MFLTQAWGSFPDTHMQTPVALSYCSLLSGAFFVNPISSLGLWNYRLYLLNPQRSMASSWVPPPRSMFSMFRQPGNSSRQEAGAILGLPSLVSWSGNIQCCLVSQVWNHCFVLFSGSSLVVQGRNKKGSSFWDLDFLIFLSPHFLMYRLHKYDLDLKGACGPAYKLKFLPLLWRCLSTVLKVGG